MKFRVLLILLTIVSVYALSPFDVEKEWLKFLRDFNPKYKSSEEYARRKSIFAENLKKFQKHNAEYEQGLHTYTMGINQFADKTEKELRDLKRGLPPSKLKDDLQRRQKRVYFYNPKVTVPETVDWTKRGAVSPVKAQGGSCFACWSFATVDSIESQYFFATNKSEIFSEQQLVDCSLDNDGCRGGLMRVAYEDLKAMGGIVREKDYPYVEREQQCKFDKKQVVAKVIGYTAIDDNEEALKQAVARHGPITAAIQTTERFRHYEGGITYYEECTDNPYDMDHAVLVVGYGTENGVDYWLIKNSWDTSWGSNGYAKIIRNRDNNCQIATYTTYPHVVPVEH